VLEKLLVAVIVATAAVYAVWALVPVGTRRNLALRGAQALGGAQAPGLAGRIAALLLKVAQAPKGGCSECPAATLTPAERSRQRRD
jgi:hypothetical protein